MQDGITTPFLEKELSKSPKTPRDGIWLALIVLLGNGIYPVISNERPASLDGFFFSLMTVLWEFMCVFPFYLIEVTIRKRKLKKVSNLKENSPNFSKINISIRMLVVGILFAVAMVGMIYGLELAGSVAGSIALKTAPLFAMLIGAILLKEKIRPWALIFTVFMLGGLYYMATIGSWNPISFSWGVGICLLIPLLWGIGHALTKPLLQYSVLTPNEVILIRTGICTILIGIPYLLINGFDAFSQWKSPIHLIFMLAMGGVYGITHLGWYLSIKKLDLGFASAMVVPSPVVTVLIAVLFLQTPLYSYQIIGLITSMIGLYGLIYSNQKTKN